MKGTKALKMYGKSGKMTDYEKLEIMDYNEVYYLGIRVADEKIKGRCGKKYNDGYDDEPGDYTVVTGDHIGYRFEVLDFLGKGSFG
jgi:dual specificity tyrosine-phosphorylation-regulated kinase 2/3/4